MTKQIFFAFISVFVIIFYSCLEQIDFEAPEEYVNSVVFQGKIVKGNPSSVELTVQNVFDFAFAEGSLFNAKEVTVINDKGQRLNVPGTSNGNYKLIIDPSLDFEVEYGGRYGIEVSLFDGRNYISDLEELIPVPKIDTAKHKLIINEYRDEEGVDVVENRVEYRVSTSLIAEPNQKLTNIAWHLERTYKKSDLIAKDICYINDFADPDKILIVNTVGNTRAQIENELVLTEVISRIMVEGHYISIIQESLDDRALSFWEQILELSTNNGTFYEPPVGQLISNFTASEGSESNAFGFFYATEQDSFHLFVDSTFIDYYTAMFPHPDFVPRENSDFGPCDDCCFCLWTPNSTLKKPSFWID